MYLWMMYTYRVYVEILLRVDNLIDRCGRGCAVCRSAGKEVILTWSAALFFVEYRVQVNSGAQLSGRVRPVMRSTLGTRLVTSQRGLMCRVRSTACSCAACGPLREPPKFKASAEFCVLTIRDRLARWRDGEPRSTLGVPSRASSCGRLSFGQQPLTADNDCDR